MNTDARPRSRGSVRSSSTLPLPRSRPRSLALAPVVALATLLPGCSPAPESTPLDQEGPPPPEAVAAVRPPATFRGTLPCADCPGIRTTLEVDADGSARLTRLYLEAEPGRDASVDARGRWGVDDAGRLTVTTSNGETLLFAFAREGLSALDREGRPYASSLPRLLERVADPASDPLSGTAWRFVEPPPADGARAAPGMRFAAGRLVGHDGCDEFTGTWSGGDGVLDLRPAATTRVDCSAPVAAGARAVRDALARAAGYRIEAGALVLRGPGGEELARLRPAA